MNVNTETVVAAFTLLTVLGSSLTWIHVQFGKAAKASQEYADREIGKAKELAAESYARRDDVASMRSELHAVNEKLDELRDDFRAVAARLPGPS